MADDKMKNDALNPGRGKQGGQQGGQGGNQPGQPGKQSPGRHPQDDEQFGQRGGGQGSTGNRELEDDEMDKGTNIGGQQPGRQNR